MTFRSINPATGQEVAAYRPMPPEQASAIVDEAHAASRTWRLQPMAFRAAVLRAAGQLLRTEAADAARVMAQEMGKPVLQGRAEAEKCAWVCDYYAERGDAFLAPELVASDAALSYVRFDPLGVVLAVMPWNFPWWQVFRAAAPALMAGNAVVLKHASNVFGCALAIERIIHRAGVPSSLFRSLLIGSDQVGVLLAHPGIAAVTLTGGTPAGQAVAARAGSLLKKTVLELGGSDPYLVLDDADLEPAIDACVNSRLINSGQSCIAAKRFLVASPVRRRFEDGMVERMRRRVMGDPLRQDVTIGPLARRDVRDRLHAQVRRSVDQGARLLLGGAIPEGAGAFYPPTVLTDVRPGMAVAAEETFGPVAAILEVRDETEAIRIANDSPFGLGASIFTADRGRGERIACQLDAGSCFINASVRSDPRLPFGGVKQSGYGRELSVFGIREFVNVKTVYAA